MPGSMVDYTHCPDHPVQFYWLSTQQNSRCLAGAAVESCHQSGPFETKGRSPRDGGELLAQKVGCKIVKVFAVAAVAEDVVVVVVAVAVGAVVVVGVGGSYDKVAGSFLVVPVGTVGDEDVEALLDLKVAVAGMIVEIIAVVVVVVAVVVAFGKSLVDL